jgi:hypothetical protein
VDERARELARRNIERGGQRKVMEWAEELA